MFIFWMFLAVVTILLCILTWRLLWWDGSFSNLPPYVKKALVFLKWKPVVILWILLGIVYFAPLYYEFPVPVGSYGCKVMWFDEQGNLKHYPYGKFGWDSYINVPTNSFSITSTETPVTDNPKIREIKYTVAAKIIDPDKFYRIEERRKIKPAYSSFTVGEVTVGKEIRKIISYWLYEFNNVNSQELGQFYNPMEPEQQQEFKTLVESWINPKIAKDGIEIKGQGFKLPKSKTY